MPGLLSPKEINARVYITENTILLWVDKQEEKKHCVRLSVCEMLAFEICKTRIFRLQIMEYDILYITSIWSLATTLCHQNTPCIDLPVCGKFAFQICETTI